MFPENRPTSEQLFGELFRPTKVEAILFFCSTQMNLAVRIVRGIKFLFFLRIRIYICLNRIYICLNRINIYSNRFNFYIRTQSTKTTGIISTMRNISTTGITTPMESTPAAGSHSNIGKHPATERTRQHNAIHRPDAARLRNTNPSPQSPGLTPPAIEPFQPHGFVVGYQSANR